MNSVRAAIAFGFVLLLTPAANAEEAAAKLPADGWWARYFVSMKRDGNNDEQTMKRTYSLVGTATENDMTCRWVEMKTVTMVGDKDRVEIVKFLIPEKELLESDQPLVRLVRCWSKTDDGMVKALSFDPPRGDGVNPQSADGRFGKELLIFPGMRQKAELVDKEKVVDYQQGRLQVAQGREGKRVSKVVGSPRAQGLSFVLDYTIWTDPAVAPGFAAARTRYATVVNEMVRTARNDEWVIEDFGKDAKSELPENN